MLRRIALWVLAAVAAAGLAAAVEPAAATPGGGTVGPAISGPGAARPALTPIGTTSRNAPSTVQDHGFLVCPPPANYDPSTAQ
jgi:hypothetical protein